MIGRRLQKTILAGFAAVSLLLSIAPAIAQPAPVPALPDTERRTSYTITGTQCSCAVNFALYGDSTDFSNWVEVFLNGTRVNYNDATYGWTITSPSGSLSTLARPITDALLTFTNAQTGTVQIVGARRPRRVSQFNENAGIPARNINQVVTDITATLREMWDKTNDMTGRGLFSQPGVTLGMLPLPSACAGKYLGFDVTGLNPACTSGGPGSGNVVGPASSTDGDFALFNGTTGALLKDAPSTVIKAAAQNAFWAGPSSGGSGAPVFRPLVGVDLPFPGASSLGGVESLTCATHQWLNTISTGGVPVCSQPTASDISGLTTPQVTIESQGGGCAVADNTSALLAAASSVSGAVTVVFPYGCTYHFTQANLINFTKPVFLQGSGAFATMLAFNPTAAGFFLKWSNGLNEIYAGGGAGLDGITLTSTDTTYTKIMVWPVDISGFRFTNSSVGWPTGQPVTGGVGSVCLFTQGREASIFDNLALECDRPLEIGMNPHFFGSVDHFHFSNFYLIAGNTFPVITVDPGVVFSNSTFDGFQIWASGTYGFYYADSAAANQVTSIGAAGTGYAAGTPITLTGGTCSTPIQILPLTVSGPGGILTASIANPGVCSVTPSNPVSAASGGATFNLGLALGINLSFSNVRPEQGTSSSAYNFYLLPAGKLQGFEIKNSFWDAGRCGVALRNVTFATIQDNGYINGLCNVAASVTSVNNNDMLVYINNMWGSSVTQIITGMNLVHSDPSPTGTSSTVPPSALYSSTITSVGVSCSGTPTASFASVNGRVTHC